MKILKNFFSSLLVFFLFSIFFALINSPSTYASSSVRYWSYTDWSATYEGHTTYPIKISKGPKTDSLMTQNAVCIEAGYSPPGYSARTTNLGTLYVDDEIWEKEPDFYYFAQKLYSNYDSLNTVTGTSYGSFAIAHMALSRKHKNHLCNIGSKKCTDIVDNKIVKKIDELSNPTTCYKMYLVENESSQDAFYADTGTTVTCPSSETTASYSVNANVTDGTTAKNASNSPSTSPHTYNVANGFSSLTLTFGGTVSRGSGATYTDNVSITYKVGNASQTSMNVGSSANTSTNNTVTIYPGTTSTDTSGDTLYVAAGATTPNICRTVTISPTSYSSTSGGSGSGTSTVCVKVSRAADEIKYAKFSGTVSSVTETGGKLVSSGGYLWTASASGSTTFKVSGSVSRKNDSTDTYSGNSYSRYNITGTSQSSSPYGLSTTNTGNLAKGGSKVMDATFEASWSNLAQGGTTSVCGYLYYDSSVKYTNGSITEQTPTAATQKCVTIKRYTDTSATFSGSVSSVSETGGKFITSGGKYYTYDASGSTTFSISGSIARSSSDSHTSNGVTSRYSIGAAQSASAYGISSSSPTVSPNRGSSSTVSGSFTGSWSNLAKGGSTTICGYLYLDTTVNFRNGSEQSRTQGTGGSKCVTLYRYSDVVARFSGSTSLGTMDPSLVCGSESSNKIACTGIASQGTYRVGFSNSVSRTGDGSSITNAAFKYAVNKNGTDDTAKTSTLKINTSKTNDGLGANSVDVSVSESDSADQKVTYCQNVKYNTSSTYYNGKLINSSGTEISASNLSMDGNSTQKCVEITRPKNFYNYAKFSSGLKITETSGYLVSCSPNELGTASAQNKTIECTGPAVQSNFTLTFEYIVNRKNDTTDTYPNSSLANSSAGTVLSEGAFSNSKYTSNLNLSTGALAKGGTKTVKTEASKSYTIKPGENKTICAYLTYNNSLKIKNNVSVVERSNANAYKCIKITNPNPQTPVSFTGTSSTPSLTDTSYFTKKSNGEYYITKAATLYPSSSAVTSSDNKYSVKYSHTVKRDNVSNYTSSNQYKYVTSAVPNSYKAQTGSGTDISGLSYSKNFSITLNTSTNVGEGDSDTRDNTVSIYLPSGSKKTNCQKINYQTPVTILYSTQTVVGTPPSVSSTQACITLANPIYEYEYRDPVDEEITITPSTAIEEVTNVVESSGTSRTTKNANKITVYMKHTLTRSSDSFSDLVSPSYTGKIGLSGTTLSVSGSGTTGNLASGASWNSSKSANSSSVYSNLDVKAGSSEAKTVCSQVTSSPGKYLIAHGYRYRRETYTDGTASTEWEQNTTSRVRAPKTSSKVIRPKNGTDAQKYANNPDVRTGSNSTGPQSCVTITRPYNFNITNISAPALGDRLDDSEELVSQTFDLTINRNSANSNLDYITDLSSKSVKIISYIVDKETSLATAQSGTLFGGGTSSSSSFCNSTNYKYKGSSCWVENPTANDTDNIIRVGTSYSSGTSYTDQKFSVQRTAPSSLEIGDKYCIAIAVSPISDSNSGWRVSNSFCRTRAKKPMMEVLGGSVLASDIKTLHTTSGNEVTGNKTYFGSWGDFALISGGTINKMASGAALSGGKTSVSTNCTYSPLTLANNNCNSSLGGATQTRDSSGYYQKIKERLIPSISQLISGSEHVGVGIWDNGYSLSNEQFSFERTNRGSYNILFKKKNDSSLVDIFRVPSASRAERKLPITYSHSSMRDYFLGTSPVVFYSSGDMEITSNFINDVDNEARQIVLIADGNIIIDENVTRIDAWLIAKETINTCSIAGVAQTVGTLNSDKCTNPLTINGPVYVKSMEFTRTYGNDSDSLGEPAEVINFTPSTLLWAYDLAKDDQTPKVTYIKELSPRY